MPALTQLSHTLFIVTSFLAILSGYQYFKYRTPMARWGGALLFSLAIELLSFSVQLVSSPVFPNIFWYVIQVLSFYFITILWLLFIFEISGFSNRLNLRFIFLIFCLPAVLLTISLSSAQGQFSNIPRSEIIGSFGQLPVLIGSYGSLLLAFLVSIGMISILFLLRLFLLPNRYNQKLALPMLLGTIFILLLSSLEPVIVNPIRLVPITQMGLAVISIFYFYMTVVWRFGGILPISRESVFEGMNDAVLILDYYNHVIDVNQPAQKFFGLNRKSAVSQNLSTIWPLGARLIEENSTEAQFEKEIELSIEGQEFTYDILITKFIGLNNVPIGNMIVLRNVTGRERMEKALNERSRDLQRTNAFMAALAEVNVTLQSATDSSEINATLGAELKKLGLTCFIAQLDSVSNELFISYMSNQSAVLRRIEKLFRINVVGFRLGRDQFPNLYTILDSEKITFRPFRPDDLADSPGKLSVILIEQAIRLIGFEPDIPAMVLPLTIGEKNLGMLGVWGSTLKESDIPPFQIFANQVAHMIERTRLYENEIQRSAELARINNLVLALTKVASVLGMTSNSEVVLDTLGKELKNTGLNCAVVTVDAAGEAAVIKYLSFSPELIQQIERISGLKIKNYTIPQRFWPGDRIFRQQAPIWYPKPGEFIRRMFPGIPDAVFKQGVKLVNLEEEEQLCILPLVHGEQTIGAMVIWGPKLKPTDSPILSVFGSQVAGIIQNTRLYDQAQKEIFERTQAEARIREALQEKEVLLKEVHHRVKNNLQVVSSLLSLQSAQIKDPVTVQLFRDSQNRVRSMALIHEKLYQSHDLARIDFKAYIQSLSSYLVRSFEAESRGVSFRLEVGPIELGIDQAIPCGLIINELVSNSLKYAFPDARKGEVHICFNLDEKNHFHLAVGDDGVGFPENIDFQNTASLGLQLVNSLVTQLEGTVELIRSSGTEFRIDFCEPV